MLKNTLNSYGWVAITMHWLMALMTLSMFGLGLFMVELTYYDAWYKGSLELHKSLGMVLLLLWLPRLFWRLFDVQPAPLPGGRVEQVFAQLMHWGLYLVMLLLMVSGYLISTSQGHGINVFNIFSVPALPWRIANQENIAGLVHEILAWLLIVMVVFHGLAAIKHQFINKDAGLMRMFKPSKS